MIFFSSRLLFTAAVAASALAAEVARGEDAPARRIRIPAAPIRASDGALMVGAAAETADYRLPVLTFAGGVRAELMRTTGLIGGSRDRPITIFLGNASNETGAAGSRVRDPSGTIREWIDVPDPERVDLDELRYLLTRALVRDWILNVSRQSGQAASGPPEWLLRGLARRQIRETRLRDYERVYRLWSRGRLPLLSDLLAADSVAVRDPAIAVVLIEFLAGPHAPGERFRALLTPLAEGGVWEVGRVLALLEPSGDPQACERAWDIWMLAGMRTIIVPGVTPPSVLRRFSNQLPVFPADVSAPVSEGWRGLSPEGLIAVADVSWARLLAARKRQQLSVVAIGRDATFQRIADAYVLFFDCIATQGDADQAAVLLQAAHIRLRDALQQAAIGKILNATQD